MVRRLSKLITYLTATVLAAYSSMILLFSLPVMEKRLAGWVAALLSDELGANVEIGSVGIGFLNRVIVSDITLHEPSGKTMATIARTSASLDIVELLSGRVVVNAAQLFGVNASLYKNTPEAEPNYQFIVNALKGDDGKEPSRIDLSINSFIMRHANINYDVKSVPVSDGTLDARHLALRDCGMNMTLRFITNDSVFCKIKRLQALEAHSGLHLQKSQVTLSANKRKADIPLLHIELPHSTISVNNLSVEYADFDKTKHFVIGETHLSASIQPADIAPIAKPLGLLGERIELEATIEGNSDAVGIHGLSAKYGDKAACSIEARLSSPLTPQRAVSANINSLAVNASGIKDIAMSASADSTVTRCLSALGNITYTGTLYAQAVPATAGRTDHTPSTGTSAQEPHTAYIIDSDGRLNTDAGNITYELGIDERRQLTCTVTADSVAIGKLAGIDDLNKTSFSLRSTANLATLKDRAVPEARAEGDIHSIEYRGYKYHGIKLGVASSPDDMIKGSLAINDDNLNLDAGFAYRNTSTKHLNLSLDMHKCLPHTLGLMNEHQGETLSGSVVADLEGRDFNTMTGSVVASNFMLSTPAGDYTVDEFIVTASHASDSHSTYIIESDFLDARIEGKVLPADIVPSFRNILSHHLPQLVTAARAAHDVDFDFDVSLSDCALLGHFIDVDYSIDKAIAAKGHARTADNTLVLKMNAPSMLYSGTQYSDVVLSCNSTAQDIHAELAAHTSKDEGDGTPQLSDISIAANARDGIVNGLIDLSLIDENTMHFQLKPTVTLTDSLGKMMTHIDLQQSSMTINDTLWTIMPASISIHEKSISCHGLQCVNSAGSSIAIDGAVSANPGDSLVAKLSNVEIKYILEAVNFDAVRFAGKASGKATVSGLLGNDKNINMNAHLSVQDFTLQEGSLGNADIRAQWNKPNESIDLKASFEDHFRVPVDLSAAMEEVTGHTTLTGWISPSRNDMRLDIMTDNTNAEFIHGFLDGVFTEVNGTLSGPVSVVGLSPVNLVGKALADISFRLRATGVPYRISGDTVTLEPDLIQLANATLIDKYGSHAALQATISHHNLKNFRYDVHADMNGLCAYEETQFNADKFFATLFAKGSIDINGADGHPLRINADVTPVRGSVFAYDAATPDAIIGSSFVEFTDRGRSDTPSTEVDKSHPAAVDSSTTSLESCDAAKDINMQHAATLSLASNSASSATQKRQDYRNDIYFSANIHLTPDCEVKLRMDNIEDGYMRTYGYANLNAQWHNKGAFQLFGNYNIQGGSYRLYLQNLIFRDLELQAGSEVEFNGNPFDATIHLVCNHTIPSVLLSDLTSTKAFSQNNKVKVNCILDITGYLESMDFKFDMELPNVSDEVRQLVRSMINSDEEMNTQMIYLLGVGRFYPSEYARSEGNYNGNNAVNSLLSSTISGQINQMLSNMIGENSNWSIGSSLTTGENGWDDLDVEGILTGRLLNERLLVNGNFGYRDNALTNQANFIGDFEVKLKLTDNGNVYVKAYNQANDRYFTKATLNTQGLGLSWQLDFDNLFRRHSPLMPRTSTSQNREKKEKQLSND